MLVGLGVTDIIRCCDGSFRDVIGVRLHVGCMIWFDYLYLGVGRRERHRVVECSIIIFWYIG